MKIKDLSSLKSFFKTIKTPILGASVYGFERLGPEEFFSDYQLLSLYQSKETDLIKKDLPIFCLEEKIGKRIRPRNASSLLCHPETQKYLRNFKNPTILLYKSSRRIEELSRKLNFNIAISPSHFGKQLFEDKIKFREIAQKIGVPPTPGRTISFSFLKNSSFSSLKEEFGFPFVLQHPRRGGGKGTFFIKDEEDLKIAKKTLANPPTQKVIAAKFVKGPTPSITGCITRFGVLSTRPQYQICDVPILYQRPDGAGLFCGHDWSASVFSQKILKEAKEIVEKVGNYFKSQGYKGIFGLDFILDEKEQKLYLTECNPRLLGSMPTLHMVQIANGESPIIAFHLLEFLSIPYDIDIQKINNLMWQKKEGAQMFLHNHLQSKAIQEGELEPGAYKVQSAKYKMHNNNLRFKSELQFIRSGYKFCHLQAKNEFLLTDGIQKKGTKLQPFQRLCRVVAKKRVLDESLKDLLPETKEFINLISENLKLVSTTKF